MTTKQKNMWDDMRAWIEKNGIYPQKGGASILQFLEQFGISKSSYHRWLKSDEEYRDDTFESLIKKANEVFVVTTVKELVNAMKKRALGYTEWKTEQYGAPDGKGGVIVTKMRRVENIVPPDAASAIFLLTNLDGDNWKNPMKIESEVKAKIVERELSKEEAKEFLKELDAKV